MKYSDWILKLRAESKDHAKPMHNDFTGDASTTLFTVTDAPIVEGTYVVKVDGMQKTEGLAADYTLDRELGLITFASAPENTKAVTIDYKYANLTDATWFGIINSIIDEMEGEFFREVTTESFGNSVDGQPSYNGPTGCIDVIGWWYRSSNNSDLMWSMINDLANWRYSKDENKLFLGAPFSTNDYPMKLHYLKGFTRGAAVADDLDVLDKFLMVLQLGCLWRYYDHRLADRVETSTKVASERTVTPLQNIQAMSQHYYKLFLKEKGRKKPTKPMRRLDSRNPRGGNP